MVATAERFHVSIRDADRDVDLTVAAHLPLRDLVPALTDAVVAVTGSAITGREVRLSHPVAGPLEMSQSLASSGIRDGDVLILSETPAPDVQSEFDPCATVVAAARSARRPRGSASTAAAVVTGWSAMVAATVLGWSALEGPRHVIPAVAVGSALLLSATLLQRRGAARPIVVAGGLGASGFAALAGGLAVPGGPDMANAALAMSAGAVVALAASRLCCSAATGLRSLCVVSASGATLSVGTVIHCWPAAAAGPVLVSGWLLVLSTAPRLVSRGARLSESDPLDANLTRRAVTAHRRLTATVATAAGGTVLGCLTTALATPRSSAQAGLLATAAAVLVLRTRIHGDAERCTALAVGAALVTTTLLAATAATAPVLVPCLCAVAAVAAAVGVLLAGKPMRWPWSGLGRIATAVDVAATASVAPLCCWAMGLFGSLRELSLS